MKKRYLRKITLGVLSSLIMTTNIYASDTGVVNVGTLNVRSGPSTNYSVIDKVNLGQELELLSLHDNWYKIMVNAQDAYVHSNYVDIQHNLAYVADNQSVLRNKPDIYGEIISNIDFGQSVEIIYKNNDWYYVSSSVGNGYILSDNLSNTPIDAKSGLDLVAKVNVSVLNMREQPTVQSSIIGKVYFSNSLDILQESSDWVYIETEAGNKGYISKNYVSVLSKSDIQKSTSLRQQIVDYSKQFIGNPYVYGGNSLTKGVDCSGFTQQILKHFDITISRTSSSQINDGTRISKSSLLPGDLVFYGYYGRISHVAMYIGNGKIIHANNPKTGIIVGNLDSSYSKPYIGASRVIN